MLGEQIIIFLCDNEEESSRKSFAMLSRAFGDDVLATEASKSLRKFPFRRQFRTRPFHLSFVSLRFLKSKIRKLSAKIYHFCLRFHKKMRRDNRFDKWAFE